MNINNKLEKKTDWFKKTKERSYYLDLDYFGRIWVDYDTYISYKRLELSELRTFKNRQKCLIKSEKKGQKFCKKSCQDCSYFNKKDISLDQLFEIYQFEFADENENIINKINQKELIEKLRSLISEFSETDQTILRLFSEGYSEKEIAQAVNLTQKAINKKKRRCFSILRNKIKKFSKFGT